MVKSHYVDICMVCVGLLCPVLLLLHQNKNNITANVLWLGEVCLRDAQFSHKFQWQLLPNRCYLLGGLSVGT
jgi:hypothetical protein